MAWFRVDDTFHASHKLMSIPKRQRLAAAGLWAIAGSWSAGQLTDGHVPNYMIEVFGATPAVTTSLVNAGLWERESDGYVFCNWHEYQPSKRDVEAERAASRRRMRDLRARRKGVKPQDSNDSGEAFGRTCANGSENVRNPNPTHTQPNTIDSSLNNESNQNLSNTYSSEKNSDGNKETSAQKLVRLKNEHPTALALCEKLVERIHAEHGRKPSIGIKWIQEAEKLMRIDGYTPHQIEYMINWALGDTFWRAHILSMSKLREKFTTLVAQAKTRHEEQQQATVSTTDKRTAEGLALIAKLEAEHEAEQAQHMIEETNLFLIGGTNE